jgi:hypothetical protein
MVKSYPRTAYALSKCCKSLRDVMRRVSFWVSWTQRFFPDLEYIDHECKTDLAKAKELFIAKWNTMLCYLELYPPDASYDMEQMVSLNIVPAFFMGEPLNYIMTISRFRGARGTYVLSQRFLKVFNWKKDKVYVGCPINLSKEAVFRVPINSINGSFIAPGYNNIGSNAGDMEPGIDTYKSVQNQELTQQFLAITQKARRTLFNLLNIDLVTTHGGFVYTHNVTLLSNLFDMKGDLVYEKGKSLKLLRFSVSDFNRAIVNVDGKEISCIFRDDAPVSNNINRCKICSENIACWALKCGHILYCDQCFMKRKNTCPVCQQFSGEFILRVSL